MVEGVEVDERTGSEGETTRKLTVKLSSRLAALDKLARIQGLYKDRVDVTDGDGIAAKLGVRRAARLARKAAKLSPEKNGE